MVENEIFPMIRALDQFLEHPLIQGMAGFVDHEMSDHRASQNSQIADEVQDFVPHEFILVPETVFIQNSEIIDDDGVVQRTAHGQAVGSQRLNISQKAEGSGTTDLFDKILSRETMFIALIPEKRVGEVDGVGYLQLIAGKKGDGTAPVTHLKGFPDDDESLWVVLFLQARAFQEKDKGTGAPIHDGDLGTVKLHPGVVNAQAEKSRHEVLHGGDFETIVADGRREIGLHHAVELCFDDRVSRNVLPDETDSVVRRRGFENHMDHLPGVKTYARARNLVSNCPLSDVHDNNLSLRNRIA